MVKRVATLSGIDLDARGITIFELEGSGLFKLAYDLFGPDGFGLPMSGLLDEDARAEWADTIGVAEADLEVEGYIVCDPDLEGSYVEALGESTVIDMLLKSPGITKNSLLKSCGVDEIDDISSQALADYCRHKKRKVRAAVSVAAGLTPEQAAKIVPIADLLAPLA